MLLSEVSHLQIDPDKQSSNPHVTKRSSKPLWETNLRTVFAERGRAERQPVGTKGIHPSFLSCAAYSRRLGLALPGHCSRLADLIRPVSILD